MRGRWSWLRRDLVCVAPVLPHVPHTQLFDDPSSSATAAAIAYLMTGIICMSVAAFIAQTYRTVREGHERDFAAIEVRVRRLVRRSARPCYH